MSTFKLLRGHVCLDECSQPCPWLMVDSLKEALSLCLEEASEAIRIAPRFHEEETYCFGNLIHVKRRAESALGQLPQGEPE